MPGLNTSGAPNTRDYVLGRGIVRLAGLTAAGLPDAAGFRDLGNAPEFSITVSVEDLRHQSSREQIKFTDKRFVISQEVGLSFQLDEINFTNLSNFLSGTTGTYDNPHDTTWAATANVQWPGTTTPFTIGNWYELVDDDGARVYNLDAAGVVYTLVEDPSGTPVTLSADDYEIDEQMGLVRFLSTGTNTLTGAEDIGFAITTGATTAQDLDTVEALQRAEVTGALLFISINAGDSGQKTEYRFHKVSLSADGDLAKISDEVATMSFTGVAEVNSAITTGSKVLRVRTYDQAA